MVEPRWKREQKDQGEGYPDIVSTEVEVPLSIS